MTHTRVRPGENGYQVLLDAVFRPYRAHRHSRHCEQIDGIVAAIVSGRTWRQIAIDFDYADGASASISGNKMLLAHGISIDRTPRVVLS